MDSYTDKNFWKYFKALPIPVQLLAMRKYFLWKNDPFHSGLHFKQIDPKFPIYSVRIGSDWRALGRKEGNSISWYWIGSHEDYNNLIKQF